MTLLYIGAYLATAGILLSYASGNAGAFNLCNAVGSIPLVVLDVAVRAYPAALVSGAFGLIGAWHLLRSHLHSRRNRWTGVR